MRILRCNTACFNLMVFGFFILVFGIKIAVVNSQESPASAMEDKKIRITADLLITNNESGFAEFSGNVRATQGTTVITSDRLKVFYKEDAGSVEKMTGGAGAMEKIVAIGNVKINIEDRKAVSSQAEYTTDTRILVLTGPDSKIITANESISGSVITFYRDDGRIKVEGREGAQVQAIFFDTGGIIGD